MARAGRMIVGRLGPARFGSLGMVSPYPPHEQHALLTASAV